MNIVTSRRWDDLRLGQCFGRCSLTLYIEFESDMINHYYNDTKTISKRV